MYMCMYMLRVCMHTYLLLLYVVHHREAWFLMMTSSLDSVHSMCAKCRNLGLMYVPADVAEMV